jgi:hypothetical protein
MPKIMGSLKHPERRHGVSRFLEGLLTAKKRIVRMPDLLGETDTQRVMYPNGYLGSIKESGEEFSKVRRIEVFAEEQSEKYGIIREFFVAYCSERRLLDLANASNSVISVRVISSSRTESRRKVISDELVLKRTDATSESIPYRPKIPDLLVPASWMDRMDLESGDRIMISNPRENYLVPPPVLADALH